MWATTNPEPDPVNGQAQRPATHLWLSVALWSKATTTTLAPRLGLAYKLGQKTVVRSGFGMFYNSTFVQELQDLRKFWPFTVQQVFSPNRGGLDLSITDPGPSFSEYLRHRRLAAESGESVTVLHAVEPVHPA